MYNSVEATGIINNAHAYDVRYSNALWEQWRFTLKVPSFGTDN